MPIRWRLTLWFSLILCGIIILSGIFIHTGLERHLRGEVDNDLHYYSDRVHGTLHQEDSARPLGYDVIHASLPRINEFASPGTYIQLIDKAGNVVVKSDNLGGHEFPVDTSLIQRGFDGAVEIKTVSAGEGASLRIMVSPLFLQDKTLLLEVGQSTKHIDTALTRLRWSILAVVLAGLAVSGISGLILARRALAPVERITRTARSIEESPDLSRRVGYIGPQDEIGKLATTFDHMLDRLDRVFKSQEQFITHASHDLRNPLMVLRGNLDLLKRNMSAEDREESMRAMGDAVQRMSKLVNDLLLLAEMESGKRDQHETVSLKEILLEGIDQARYVAGRRTIRIQRQENLMVKGNPHRLSRLLANLLDNAIKYTPDGGLITLSISRDGAWARMEVADSGIGIAPEHLPRLFERFYRVEKSRSDEGSGLGLAIVKSIAEEHGGKVAVTSEPGKGSTFTIWLPLA